MKSIEQLVTDAMQLGTDRKPQLCPRCHATELPPHAGAHELCQPCTDRLRREAERRHVLSALHLPRPDVDAIVSERLRETKALEHVRRWLATDTRLLVLCGGVGAGKSLAGGYALWTLGGAAVRAAELPQRLEPWGDEASRYSRLDVHSPGLVVLDDLGDEVDSERWRDAFGKFVSARYAEGRTIITTNLRKFELRHRYGDRIADRFNHIGVAREVSGKSMRRKGEL